MLKEKMKIEISYYFSQMQTLTSEFTGQNFSEFLPQKFFVFSVPIGFPIGRTQKIQNIAFLDVDI